MSKRICSAEGCASTAIYAQFCRVHYRRWKANGDPHAVKQMSARHHGMPMSERFWTKVDIRSKDECWEWQAGKNRQGYGKFRLGGRDSKTVHAHRVAWELHNGQPFPDGLMGCHTCDNPPCVNPHHIVPGTGSFNQQDMLRKGRLGRRGKRGN